MLFVNLFIVNEARRTVYCSSTGDAAANLAMEEALFMDAEPGSNTLFLYENDLSIIIGRFQNPWRECNIELSEKMEARILRRISGGGTVVHSRGNLNIAFIGGSSSLEKERNLEMVVQVLKRMGASVRVNSRFDIVAGNQEEELEPGKLSGSAFRRISGKSLHHATLLVNADTTILSRLLHVPSRDMDAKGVVSHPSPVINLKELIGEVGVWPVASGLAEAWNGSVELDSINPSHFKEHGGFLNAKARLCSAEWTWGATPPFRERFSGLSGLKDDVLEIRVQKGRIADFSGVCDKMLIDGLERNLSGCNYRGDCILEAWPSPVPAWVKDLAERVDGRTSSFKFDPHIRQ